MSRLPCPPEQWPQFSQLLYAALELPVEQRAAWLDTLPADQVHLRAGLARVLEQAVRGGQPEFLRAPMVPPGTLSDFASGRRVGPYTLERQLGRGGMGEVWLAVRGDGIPNRRVALKLPYAHLLAGPLRQRFERERDILAALSHPHIAPLYDAGVGDDGHPYLAMEWIDGLPITAYCREARLSLEARLDLFRQVLDAVRYAHARFIAHRDLKPSNILVTRDGQVKLLDFGIAKLLGTDPGGVLTELTQQGGRVATPEYAAPEQIAGEPITTAVDLYALGLILFELLTGAHPFRPAAARREPAPDAPLASQRVTDAAAQSIGGVAVASLRRRLRGDLDAVVARALEADPAQRYGSAEAFADDLDRYRRQEPVAARHISRLARIGKFIHRNRAASALAAGLLLALVAGTVGIGIEAIEAREEAKHAQTEARREKAARDFLIGVFKASDPRAESDRPRGTITARELLDVSSDRIEKNFAGDPDTEIELLGIVSDIYGEFSEEQKSQGLLRKKMELAQARYGEASPAVIDGLLRQASNANDNDDYATAQKLLARTDDLIRQAGLDRSVERAKWWLVRSSALIADAAAEKQRAEALQKSVELFAAIAPDDHDYPSALSELANIYFAKPDFPKAVDYNRRAVAVLEGQEGGDEGDLVQLYGNLGMTLTYVGDFDGAERAYARATDFAKRTYGESHRFYWIAAARYAQTMHLRGDRERASRLFEQLLPTIPDKATGFRNVTDEHEAAIVNEAWGSCLSADGRASKAVEFLERADREYTEAPQYFYEIAHLRAVLGIAEDRAGRSEDARAMLKGALDKYGTLFKPDNPGVLKQRQAWGDFLLRHGELDEAERQFRDVLQRAPDHTAYYVALAHGGLAQVAIARHASAAAMEASRRAVDTFDHVTGFRDVRTGPQLWRIRAEALLLAGDVRGAQDWAQRAVDADRRYDDPSSSDIVEAEATLRAVQKAMAAKV